MRSGRNALNESGDVNFPRIAARNAPYRRGLARNAQEIHPFRPSLVPLGPFCTRGAGSRNASLRPSEFSLGERGQCPATGFHYHHRSRIVARRHRGVRIDFRFRAIKTNIGDSLNVVIQIDRRPGRRFISEVLEINGYDPDADLFDFGVVYVAPREHA